MVPSGSAKVRERFSMCNEEQPRTGFGVAVPMSEPFAQYPYGAYPVPEPPRRPRGRHVLGLAATAVVAAAAGAGAVVGLSHGSNSSAGATATSKEVLSTAQIASRVDPGIVDVTSTLGYQDATAKGTGIVLTSTGEILTNNHVISGATSVSVTDIANGKTYKATVVGYDESHDIAVLQLSGASGLTRPTAAGPRCRGSRRNRPRSPCRSCRWRCRSRSPTWRR